MPLAAIFSRLFSAKSPKRALRLAVDLSYLQAEGGAGGVKPFVFEYLRGLMRLEGDALTLVFLTCSSSHAEARGLARSRDELVCVRDDDPKAAAAIGTKPGNETRWPNPPTDLLRRLRTDLYYAPLFHTDYACPGIPTIAAIVDVLHRDFPATLSPAHVAQREKQFQQLVRIVDRFQCISNYTAGRLQHHYQIPRERIFRSLLAVHQRLGERGTRDHRKPYFLYPANSWAHKNHHGLLKAYALYRTRHGAGAWQLVLTGADDPGMQAILKQAGDLGLADSVTFRGHLPAAEFSETWTNAGALAFPSLHEGFGIPLVEAMHFEVPILSSRASSLPEVAGNAALYANAEDPVEWGNAMLALATDAGLRAELVEKGRQRLATFSLADEIQAFREAVRETAAAPARYR